MLTFKDIKYELLRRQAQDLGPVWIAARGWGAYKVLDFQKTVFPFLVCENKSGKILLRESAMHNMHIVYSLDSEYDPEVIAEIQQDEYVSSL